MSTSSLASLICHHSWNLLALPEHMRIHVVGCWLRAAQIRHTSKYESQISLGCTGQSLQTCIHIKCEGGYTSHLQDATDKSHCLQVSKFERLRLTGGDPEAILAWMDTEGGRKAPTNPQNAWTQGRPAVSASAGGSQPRGQWSKQGKLAHEWKTIQDAWSQK